MKKYLILSVASVTLCLMLIVRLYKTVDIPWIDSLVEGASEMIGIEPEMVREKVKRRQAAQPVMELLVPMDTIAAIETVDTISVQPDTLVTASVVLPAKTKRRLFNVIVDSSVVKAPPPVVDTVQVVAHASPISPQRKKLFNTQIDKAVEEAKPQEEAITYFSAKVNSPQRFGNDEQVSFRTVKDLTLGDLRMPANYVFSARASVLNNRIHFYLEAINKLPISGENFTGKARGIKLTDELRLGEGYYVPEGYLVTFGVKP